MSGLRRSYVIPVWVLAVAALVALPAAADGGRTSGSRTVAIHPTTAPARTAKPAGQPARLAAPRGNATGAAASRPTPRLGAHAPAATPTGAATKASGTQRWISKMPRWLGDLVQTIRLHPRHFAQRGAHGRFTEERPFLDLTADLLGIDLGLTLSETSRIGGSGNFEFVHVSDGVGHNLETVLARRQLGHGQRLELQGPALNTTGVIPSGVRFAGLGLTSDFYEPRRQRAISYTLEAKLTQRALFYWAPLYGPRVAHLADRVVGASRDVGIGDVISSAIPFVSAGLAVQSVWGAYKTFRDPRASTGTRLLAAGHAAADITRVFFPLAGTLANVALVAVSGAITYRQVRSNRAADP